MTPINHPLQKTETFALLFEQHHLTVFRFIYGLSGGTLHNVEDLTAETFMRAWKARCRFEGDQRAALGWLLTIARNLVIDSARRNKIRQDEQLIADLDECQQLFPDPTSESAEGQVLRREQIGILFLQLTNLPSERREMLVLRYILGWSVKEVASHLGMLENTVSVYLHRAIEQLRRDWPGEDL